MRLTVEELHKVFGDVIAVDGVTCCFLAGRIYGLVGENGAGKTTFVRILAGHVPLTSGSIKLTIGSEEIKYPDVVRHIGIIPQLTNFVQEWDASKNVFLGSELTQWDVIRADLQRSKIAELEAYLFPLPSGRPGSWSPTERTRVAVF